MLVEKYIVYLALILVGLCLGSFSGATMWRLRARQLAQDKHDGEKIDHDEFEKLKKLNSASILSPKDHSVCLNCSYRLKWYDLIPLFSWLYLGGRCRRCHKRIGRMEPLMEIGMVAYFVLSFMFWPYPLNNWLEISRLVLWLIAGVPIAILFAYDARWSLMDRKANYSLVLVGAISALTVILNSSDKSSTFFGICGSVLILGGLYYAIYRLSNGKWVGGADPVLGLGLGLMLADWRLAFVALFAANLIGCLVVIPGLATKKLKRDSHVPFGPLLITGFIIAGLAGNYLIEFYINSFL